MIYRERPGYRRLQRALDVITAVVAIPIALPIMAIACVAIAVEDGRPFLFTQRRIGRFGRPFTMYKLRTMRSSACGSSYKPGPNDGRLTRVGAILRRASIDELPQLVNVLRGEMAVVGPRPEMPFIVERYERWQHLRHLVPPGITGLWQTRCRSTIPLDHPEATVIDIEYVTRSSPLLDVMLIFTTIRAIVLARGAF